MGWHICCYPVPGENELTMKPLFSIVRISSLVILCSTPIFAQTTNATVAPAAPAATTPPPSPPNTSTPATATKPGGAVATMSTIVVVAPAPTTTDAATSVLPDSTPVSSVFGNDMSVKDTPRSVTVLTPEILQAYDVRSLQDLSKTAPSAYQTDQFGGYSVPNIRGQEAEVFVNGQQRTTRSDGPPTSFNSIESAAIVNGPASSVYGPTGYTGGYVNFVTKQPYFDAWHSTTSFTYGSYDTKRWMEDFGAPIIPGELAFRASYMGEDSGSYYDNVKNESQDGFFALAYKPNNDFHIDFNTEFQEVRFNEVTGLNRPTQDLINDHDYLTGPGGIFGVVTPTGETHISDNATLISPQDSDYAKDYNAQLTMTYDPGDGISVINRAYYEYEYLRNSEYAQYYSNLLNSNNFQDRLEVHIDFDTPVGGTAAKSDPKDMKDMKAIAAGDPLTFKSNIITGLAFKYISLNDYQGFLNEALNGTDLTTGAFPGIGLNAGSTNVFPIPGTNLLGSPGGNYGTAGFPFNQPGSIDESAYEGSAFFQHNITFTPQWSLLYGLRGDMIYDDIKDSLPATGFAAVADNTLEAEGSANVSIDYKPVDWLTTYLTYSYNQSYNGNTGGGFNTFSANNNLSGNAYHLENTLYEGGAKVDMFNHTFYASAASYYQTHEAVTSLGGVAEIRTLGAELQQTYQPDKHFFLSFNESYLQATIIDPTAEFTETSADITNPPGTPNFIVPPTGHYREGGLPQFLLNGIGSYTLDCGVGASLSYQITDPIPTSEVDPIWIPWQYEIDASLFYKQKNWEAQLNFFNITDQHNFSTGGFIAGTGNDLITIGEPFHIL
jgi:outer membrane receptor protein involved in Fe transport